MLCYPPDGGESEGGDRSRDHRWFSIFCRVFFAQGYERMAQAGSERGPYRGMRPLETSCSYFFIAAKSGQAGCPRAYCIAKKKIRHGFPMAGNLPPSRGGVVLHLTWKYGDFQELSVSCLLSDARYLVAYVRTLVVGVAYVVHSYSFL